MQILKLKNEATTKGYNLAFHDKEDADAFAEFIQFSDIAVMGITEVVDAHEVTYETMACLDGTMEPIAVNVEDGFEFHTLSECSNQSECPIHPSEDSADAGNTYAA